MLGDIVGKPGRQAVARHLPEIVEERRPDIVIANGENAAGGLGITKETALSLFDAGIDVITLGNHVWNQRGSETFINEEPRILRPANFPPGLPGRGAGVFAAKGGRKIGVLNLLGRTFMQPVDDPFRAADAHLEELRAQTPVILVDIHAEATSEKAALAWDIDGRASAVIGTHTHVATCDGRILPKGTAFLTDVGMVGPRDSILGLKPEMVIRGFRTQIKQRFELADGPAIISGAVLDLDDETGRARSIENVALVSSF